jgi:triosephosphate isomerase
MQNNVNNEKFGMNAMSPSEANDVDELTSNIVREAVIPEIEKEVNAGEQFANLRQIYSAMVLAAWYKRRLKDSLLGQIYVNKNKVVGVDVEDKQDKDKIYNQYLEAFKTGVYNLIKEEYDPATQEVLPRKYFSGGFEGAQIDGALRVSSGVRALTPDLRIKASSAITDGQDSSVFVRGVEAGKDAKLEVVNQISRSVSSPVSASLEAVQNTFRKAVIGGNFKLNIESPGKLKELIFDLAQGVSTVFEATDVFIAPSIDQMATAAQAIKEAEELFGLKQGSIQLGAQNVSAGQQGAFTGGLPTVQQLKNLGVTYVIVGHSEDRRGPVAKETNQDVNAKVKAVISGGLIPVLAFGESLAEREANQTNDIIRTQLLESLADVTAEQILNSGLVLAYEPVWAIGTGKTATPEQAEEVQGFVRGVLLEQFGPEVASKVRIQYGGSVTDKNAFGIAQKINVDGALVGGAALKSATFLPILASYARAGKDKELVLASSPVQSKAEKASEEALESWFDSRVSIQGADLQEKFKKANRFFVERLLSNLFASTREFADAIFAELVKVTFTPSLAGKNYFTVKVQGKIHPTASDEDVERAQQTFLKNASIKISDEEDVVATLNMSVDSKNSSQRTFTIEISDVPVVALYPTNAFVLRDILSELPVGIKKEGSVSAWDEVLDRKTADFLTGVVNRIKSLKGEIGSISAMSSEDDGLSASKLAQNTVRISISLLFNGQQEATRSRLLTYVEKEIQEKDIAGQAIAYFNELELNLSTVKPFRSSASSPISSEMKIDDQSRRAIQRIVEQQIPVMLANVKEIYGLDQVSANRLTQNKFSRIGFDGPHNRLGWTMPYLNEIISNPEMLLQTLQDAENIRENYKYVIFSGMGGSGLSVQTVKTTFGEPEGLNIYSLRTTDSAVIAEILEDIAAKEGGNLAQALAKTKIVVVSKSGTTQETRSHQDYFEKLFAAKAVNPSGHFMLVTDPGSPMEKEAQDKGYDLRYIQLNKKTDVGGRFTAPATNVFLLPLAIVEPSSVVPILKRAQMNNDNSPQDVFTRLGAFLYYMASQQGKDKVTIIVPEIFKDFPSWAEQLVEESLGKDGKGVTLFYNELTSDNQLKPVAENDRVFIRINVGGILAPTNIENALQTKGYPVFDINVNNSDDLGALMLGFQRAVATVAYLWDINFVNQPGVEGYKKETRDVLSTLKAGAKVQVPFTWNFARYNELKVYYTPMVEAGILTEEELNAEVARLSSTMDNGAAVYAALINIALAKAKANPSYGTFEVAEFASYGRMTQGFRAVVDDAIQNIFTTKLKMPAKLAEGPDKNHSFQQNIAQGKNMFFSTYFMPLVTRQPDDLVYDDNPLRAQTIGTVNSLSKVGRKVVLITMDSTIESSKDLMAEFFHDVAGYLGTSGSEFLTSSSSPVGSKAKEYVNPYYPILLKEVQDGHWKEVKIILDILKTQTELIPSAGTIALEITNLLMERLASSEKDVRDLAQGVLTVIQGEGVDARLAEASQEVSLGTDVLKEIVAERVKRSAVKPVLGNWQRWLAEPPLTIKEINLDMFRDYDFRSTGPQITPKIAFHLGLVWAQMALNKAKAGGIESRDVLISRDARKVEPDVIDALIAAMRYSGLNVHYMAAEAPNAVTSYSWGVQQFRPIMSIFMTASHVSRPVDINVGGFKVAMLNEVGGNIQSLTTKEIKSGSLNALKDIVRKPQMMATFRAENPGEFISENINDNVIRFNTVLGKIAGANKSLYDLGRRIKESQDPLTELFLLEKETASIEPPLKGMRIVVEGSHTPSGFLTARTFENLGATVVSLHEDVREISGEHKADPSIRSNLKELNDKMIEVDADFGIAFDLDGDRGAVDILERIPGTDQFRFETLAPDNLIVTLLPSLKKYWGYGALGESKKVGVIRDVLGTQGVNDVAAQLGVDMFQTDAGYVFLKAVKEKNEKEGYIFPIYGERSGHTWLHATGEIENPLAVTILFALLAKREQSSAFEKRNAGQSSAEESLNPVLDAYRANTIPYSQSPRFQPLFHPELIKSLSQDPRNTTGWTFDSQSPTKQPPQMIIALGRDFAIRKLQEEFTVGKSFTTSAGELTVASFNAYQDATEDGGLYRFADIVFNHEGKFAGRFVFRASSNDPAFVSSYEAKQYSGEGKQQADQLRMAIGGLVLNFLDNNNIALLTQAKMVEQLVRPNLGEDKVVEMFTKANLKPVEGDLLASRSGQAASPVQAVNEGDEEESILPFVDFRAQSDKVESIPTTVDKYDETVADEGYSPINEVEPSDQRVGSSPVNQDNLKGGIDFDPALLDLKIKRDEKGIPLPLNMQPVDTIERQIQGIIPVIINVVPVRSVPMLLGISEQEAQDLMVFNDRKIWAKEVEAQESVS